MSVFDYLPWGDDMDLNGPEEPSEPRLRVGDKALGGVIRWVRWNKFDGSVRYGIKFPGAKGLEFFDEEEL